MDHKRGGGGARSTRSGRRAEARGRRTARGVKGECKLGDKRGGRVGEAAAAAAHWSPSRNGGRRPCRWRCAPR
eukprot:1888157-Pleurochrysis_carterae.AAC.1